MTMTLDQLERAKAVVMADATGTSWPLAYRDGVREYCALGGLAIAAGLRDEEIDLGIRLAGGSSVAAVPYSSPVALVYERIRAAVKREFGIETEGTRFIWVANDRHPEENDTIEARRERVCAALDWLYANQ